MRFLKLALTTALASSYRFTDPRCSILAVQYYQPITVPDGTSPQVWQEFSSVTAEVLLIKP